MEYSAILHDMDKRFCYAIDKGVFVIRIQVKKDDIKEIILHYVDKYISKDSSQINLVIQQLPIPQFFLLLKLQRYSWYQNPSYR